MKRFAGAVLGAITVCALAQAAEPVRRVGVYVEPYYRSAPEGGAPQVAVGKRYDELLASGKREDILAARDLIERDAKTVTPMAMMVLAIRLYDVGLRDDAVFWFYAAKDRYLVFSEVIDPNGRGVAGATDAVSAFSMLAGPTINGYALCDVANQKAIRARALDWVEAHPYEPMFMPQLPALPGDRAANAQRGMQLARGNAGKERAYLEDARNVEQIQASRKKNETDAKYCWR